MTDFEQFTDSLGKLVSNGMKELEDQKPLAALDVGQLLQSNQGGIRVIVDMAPLNINVYLTKAEDSPLLLFSLGNTNDLTH